MIEQTWRVLGWLGIALTLVVSLMPPALDTSGGHADKIVHLAGYAVLTFWWAQLVTRQRWKLAIAVVLFGIIIELLQGLTPARQPDLLDALANSGGVMLGWLAARLLPNLPARLAARRTILPAPHR
ncbi:MAG TPA: VanZ family protein [Thiobacillus sp.]|nr:VanZ family protein [Gammaproteobacteria bacterium]OYZ30062.1 MAG: VanZ family protein [Hydrogenophilales bacterium 16-64-40]OZA35170.1 MAG: VanZ family protein [Hydrogenophilales bacterium 17-64-65]HQS82407.1 VanZ family protein [Thiobacillus sp.]HQT32539.1 VanZ family protein [Thiobacillus sp.]